MQQLSIGSGDINVSKLSFGTGSMHHILSFKKRIKLLDTAAESGFTHFDTSPYYGYGLAEKDLGRFIRGRRGQFTVATKVGLYPPDKIYKNGFALTARKIIEKLKPSLSFPKIDWHIKSSERSLHLSLKTLGTEYVDIVYLHEPDIALISTDEYLRWLERMVNSGHVRAWGLAGEKENLIPFLGQGGFSAGLLQTRDSISLDQVKFLKTFNKKANFTYGYLSQNPPVPGRSVEDILDLASKKHSNGSIIVSTKSCLRVKEMARYFA